MAENTPQFTPEEAAVALSRSWDVHRQAFGPILEPAFPDNVPVRIHLVAALNLISRREVKPGLQKLQEIKEYCQTSEDWAAWYFFVGLCFEMTGIREQMVTFYEKSGEYNHRFYLPYLKVAKEFHTNGDYEKAEKYYIRAISCLDTKEDSFMSGSAWANYASCLASWGKLEQAEKALLRSKRILPEFQGRDTLEAALLMELRNAGRECALKDSRLDAYRQRLLEAGFHEALHYTYRFWKQTTDLTVFCVNLDRTQDGVEIIYGYGVNYIKKPTKADKRLIELGMRRNDITIRQKLIIQNEADESVARQKIDALYQNYRLTEKDALLAVAKEKRKEFIGQLGRILKPLGLKKKANTWTIELSTEVYLSFSASRMADADEYYFVIHIGKIGFTAFAVCYHICIEPEGALGLDWQLCGNDGLKAFMDEMVIPVLKRFIHTPLDELGNCEDIWNECYCNKKYCQKCWVQKNVWELREEKNKDDKTES